jgi:hypothetical protein
VAGDARLAGAPASLSAADRRPPAIIETIGVNPEYACRRVGRALMSPLSVSQGALRVERVETILAPRDLALQGFL